VTRRPPWGGVGVALPCVDAYGTGSPVVEVARAADEAGLDHVWVPDHLLFHRPVLESLMTLAVVAGATERVRLGTAILNPVLRSTTWLAKQLSTLAVLAPERLLLGVGLGGEYELEFRAAGVDKRERGRRLDEALTLLPGLLGGAAVDHDGLQRVDVAGFAPACDTLPPILVGGRSEAALRRAARFGDAWLPMWMDPDAIAEARAQLGEQAAAHGRPAPGVALVAFVNVCEDRERGRAQAKELTERQYGMPFERVERWTAVGDVDEVTAWLARYRDAGVDGFSLAIADPDQLVQVQRIAEVRTRLQAS
jgi:alkanesulfonate monooxygenase SsuD/methylene tetrahydromethanopterin reductase-like flavin-dependent oxidoreductase (luciferase family)